MEMFPEALNPKISTERSAEISKMIVAEVAARGKKQTKMDLSKYDWNRVEFANLRDPRCHEPPCCGAHSPEGFGRGSLTGCNSHAVWIVCAKCRLRILYCPTWSAKGSYRSAGPIGEDVKSKLLKDPTPSPREMTTQALGIEAAEASAEKRLTILREQKAKIKAKAKPQMTKEKEITEEELKLLEKSSSAAAKAKNPPAPKKSAKRENEVHPETQEVSDEDFLTVK